MTTSTHEPGQDQRVLPRHRGRRDEWAGEIRRAVTMATLLRSGGHVSGADIVPLPQRRTGARDAPRSGGSATILLFTGITRVRA